MRKATFVALFLVLFTPAGFCALQSADVPSTLQPAGSAEEDPPGTWTISGSGVDIWGTSDEFHFLYDTEPRSGDFALSCHVVSFGGTGSSWGKAGLMARNGSPEFTGPESYAFCCATTGNGACLQWRDGDGTNAAWDDTINQWLVGPEEVWLKLVRRGDTFEGYASVQPPLWRSLNSHTFTSLLPDQELYVGLAVTAHEAGSLATAVIDQIRLDDPGISEAALGDFTCVASDSEVQISWTNAAQYDEIHLYRQSAEGLIEEILPGPDPTSESFTDTPGDGIFSYWIAAVEDGAPTVAQRCGPVFIGEETGYVGAVLSDVPIAYWRLGEAEGSMTAVNIGALGAAVNGTYLGGVELEAASLLPSGEDAAVLFNGVDAEVQIPDHGEINTAGPYLARTVELWFETEAVGTTPSVIYEEGGRTRGINVYVVEVNRKPRVFVSAWNRDVNQTAWGPLYASAEIELGVPQYVVLVYVATENEEFGDRDGRVTGYINGEEIRTIRLADRLFAHADDIAIGGVVGNTIFHDGTSPGGAGGNFAGIIDEVALYDYALDDPNGDWDLSDSRIPVHLQAARGGGPPPEGAFKRGDVNADGTRNIADAVSVLTYAFAGGDPPPCMDSADGNDDSGINIADAVSILNHLFGGGGDLPAPFAECGPDPTPDDLTCDSFPPCQ